MASMNSVYLKGARRAELDLIIVLAVVPLNPEYHPGNQALQAPSLPIRWSVSLIRVATALPGMPLWNPFIANSIPACGTCSFAEFFTEDRFLVLQEGFRRPHSRPGTYEPPCVWLPLVPAVSRLAFPTPSLHSRSGCWQRVPWRPPGFAVGKCSRPAGPGCPLSWLGRYISLPRSAAAQSFWRDQPPACTRGA